MQEVIIIMNSLRWQTYKRMMHTIPTCCACRKPILLNDRCTSSSGKITKYFCEKCSNKNIIVFQVQRRPLVCITKKDSRMLVVKQ